VVVVVVGGEEGFCKAKSDEEEDKRFYSKQTLKERRVRNKEI